MFKKIIGTQILVQWSDNPKPELLLNEMDDRTAQIFDDWLGDIEAEENQTIKQNYNKKYHPKMQTSRRNRHEI